MTALRRALGALDATMLNVGVMVGSAVFLTASDVARALPHPLLQLAAWLVAALFSLAGALTIAELGAALPDAGGLYVYLRRAFGPFWGFLYGWSLFAVIQTASIAAVAVGFASYFGHFVPLSPDKARLLAAFAIAGLTAINVLGVREGVITQNVVTFAKMALVLGFVVFAFTLRAGSWEHLTAPVAMRSPGLSALGLGLVGPLFAFDGWITLSYMGGEVKSPARNLPLAALASVAVVGARAPGASRRRSRRRHGRPGHARRPEREHPRRSSRPLRDGRGWPLLASRRAGPSAVPHSRAGAGRPGGGLRGLRVHRPLRAASHQRALRFLALLCAGRPRGVRAPPRPVDRAALSGARLSLGAWRVRRLRGAAPSEHHRRRPARFLAGSGAPPHGRAGLPVVFTHREAGSGLKSSELDSLRERQIASPVHRRGLAPHVRLPRVGAGLAAAARILLPAEGAADLGAAGACVHVRDAAVGPRGGEEPLRGPQAVGEDGARQPLRHRVVRAQRLVEVVHLEDVEDGREGLLPGDGEVLVARRHDQRRLD